MFDEEKISRNLELRCLQFTRSQSFSTMILTEKNWGQRNCDSTKNEVGELVNDRHRLEL